MFIHKQSGQAIHAKPGTSISWGTHRPQDLIPRYLNVLRDTPEYVQITQSIPSHIYEDDQAAWWTEQGQEYLLMLTELLEQYAPDGYSFSTLEGDGSDFGYWSCIIYECSRCQKEVGGIPLFDHDDTGAKDLYECPECGWWETNN